MATFVLLSGWLMLAYAATVILDLDTPVILLTVGFAFGLVDGRAWPAFTPLGLALIAVVALGAAALLSGACALCTSEQGFASGAVLLVGALALPVSLLIALGALVRSLAEAAYRKTRD